MVELLCIKKRIVPILIDTGASWSCICKGLCDNIHTLKEPSKVYNFEGKIEQYTSFAKIKLNLLKDQQFQLKIMISEVDKNEIILGMDFLENFDTGSNTITKLRIKPPYRFPTQ